VEISLKEYPEKVIHIDIVIVDVPDMWGMLLSRKFSSMLGGTLEMDLSFIELPLKNGVIGRLLNEPVTKTHVQEANHPVKNDKHMMRSYKLFINSLLKICLLHQKKTLTKLNGPKGKNTSNSWMNSRTRKTGTVKILKRPEDDVQIHPSPQEVFTAEAHPPPSAQYTRVVQETTKYKIRNTRKEI
jgi:hypothetical protein